MNHCVWRCISQHRPLILSIFPVAFYYHSWTEAYVGLRVNDLDCIHGGLHWRIDYVAESLLFESKLCIYLSGMGVELEYGMEMEMDLIIHRLS